MSRSILTVLSCLLVLASTWADDKEDAARKEQEKFKGQWKHTTEDEVFLTINGVDYEFSYKGMKEKGKMKFNPAPKQAEVDVEITEGSDAGKKQVGIYEFKDGKLKLCFAQAGETKRPNKFESSGDGSMILFEFEKKK